MNRILNLLILLVLSVSVSFAIGGKAIEKQNIPIDREIVGSEQELMQPSSDVVYETPVAAFKQPLAGTYTIGTGGDFPMLRNAILYLNANGITDDVTFLFTDPAYTDTGLSILNFSNPNLKTVTFKPAPGVVTSIYFSGGASLGGFRYGLHFQTTANIVWDGSNSGGTDRSLTIQMDTTIVPRANAIIVRRASNNLTFKNLNIVGYRNLGQGGLDVVRFDNAITGTPGPQFNITIENCLIKQGGGGIFIRGQNGTNFDYNYTIRNNFLGGGSAANINEHLQFSAIWTENVKNVTIERNEINGIRTAPAGGSPVALNLRIGSADVVASYNKISNIVNLAGASRPLVIIFGGSGTGVAYRLTAKLFNNMVYDIHNFGTGSGGRGMNLLFGNPTAPPWGTTGVGSKIEVYHNTFHIVMGPSEGTGNTAFIWDGNFLGSGTTAGHIDEVIAYNNIYSIQRANDFVRHHLWFAEAAPGNLVVDMDYNLYWDNRFGFFAQAVDPWPSGTGVMLPTLQDWATLTGNDENSKFAYPEFVSAVDAHISTAIGVVSPADAMGTEDYTFVDDIDGEIRVNLTPVDVGADAFIPTPWNYDALPVAILSPYVGGVPMGYPIPIAVRVRNNSINTFPITAEFTVYDETGTNIVFGPILGTTDDEVYPYDMGTVEFNDRWTPTTAGTYLLVVKTTLGGDENPANDILSRTQVVKEYVVVGNISTTPYFDNFEGGPKTQTGWEPEVITNKSEWNLGTPTKFDGAYSGVNAWYVGAAAAEYTVDWIAALNTPYFIFNATDKPIISFKHKFSIEDDWDGVIVQYTEDFGASWKTLGVYNDPNGKNWYNENASTFIFGYPPGGFSDKNNLYPDWDYAQLKAYELAGKMVRLRFVFGSDGYVVDLGYAMDDFGIANASSIAGLKWYDANQDGVKDPTEAVLEGWTINLSGTVTDSKVTDNEGKYVFTDLFDGSYVVSEELKPGWVNTYPAGGSYNITLAPGQSEVDKNFGNYWANASITGMKWDDLNANGIKDAGEPGLDGWTVNLSGPVSGTTETAGGGLYAFNNLTEGTYTVSEVVKPGWKKTYPATVHTVEITADGQVVADVNFGNFKYATISGIVYRDINRNGVKDASEPGVDGVPVNLTGPEPMSTVTAGGGFYSLTAFYGANNLTAVAPTGKYFTVPTGGNYPINVTTSGMVFADMNFGLSTLLDTTKFRSFLPEDIVALDAKGKVPKAVKQKADKVEFEIDFTVPAGGPFNTLHLEWGSAPITGFPFIVEKNGTPLNPGDYTLTPAIDGKAKKFDLAFSANLTEGDVITIHAHAAKGKEQKGKYWWLPATKPTKLVMGPFTLNQPRLPMPSYANLIGEVYVDGGFAADGGLLVGTPRPDAPKDFGWVLMAKPGDVQKSLRDKTGLHTGGPKFFDVFENGKPLVKLQKTLPPSKHNNKLFAELVALRLAIAASATEHTALGFGELVFDDTVSALLPFNGMQIKAIFAQASAAMTSKTGNANLYYQIVRKLNEAFAGPIDTISFASKTVLKGVRDLTQVKFLRIDEGAVIARITPDERNYADVPDIFELAQNYPNPFNPTTTIQFILPEDALVTLKVYNILGQEVATLANKELFTEGMNEVEFDAGKLASGVYFYQLTAEGVGEDAQKFSQVKKMVLMK